MTDEQKNNALKMPPAPPPSALDYVIKMAKKRLLFIMKTKKLVPMKQLSFLKITRN